MGVMKGDAGSLDYSLYGDIPCFLLRTSEISLGPLPG